MCNVVLALPMECWRWIPGYEGWYQVSTRGRVRSVDRWVTAKDGRKYFYKGRILKLTRNERGYLQVRLSRDGKERTFKVHRLVLEVWGNGNLENKPEVNHLDEDKTNNEVYNLSWSTRKDNVNFGTRNKRSADSQSIPVQAIDVKTGEVVREFPSMMEAGRNGFNSGAISLCCRGKRRTHHGFEWRFKP